VTVKLRRIKRAPVTRLIASSRPASAVITAATPVKKTRVFRKIHLGLLTARKRAVKAEGIAVVVFLRALTGRWTYSDDILRDVCKCRFTGWFAMLPRKANHLFLFFADYEFVSYFFRRLFITMSGCHSVARTFHQSMRLAFGLIVLDIQVPLCVSVFFDLSAYPH
jgi:hypothetical protein